MLASGEHSQRGIVETKWEYIGLYKKEEEKENRYLWFFIY